MQNAGMEEAQAGISFGPKRLLGEISITSDIADDTTVLAED